MADKKDKAQDAQQGQSKPDGSALNTNGNGHEDSELQTEDEAKENQEEEGHEEHAHDDAAGDSLIPIIVVLPEGKGNLSLMVSPHEPVHELRQSIIDLPVAFQYSCFHLQHAGERINDYVQVSEVPDLKPESEVKLVLDPYTEKEARLHFIRIRELIGAAGDRTDTIHGMFAGISLFDTVDPQPAEEQNVGQQKKPQQAQPKDVPLPAYNFDEPPKLGHLLPKDSDPAPKTVKAISLSSWNPPPPHLRQKGHLLYLIVTTNEGEQFQITSHIGGFYVNRSSNSKFDPSPRPPPKNASSHSLLSLIDELSPSFSASFTRLQEFSNRRDPLSTFQITNATPTAPWLVPPVMSQSCIHQPDNTRSQESYLISGVENTDTLRDWNEEFQSARELPKEAVQDRVFRERLTSKLFADYTDAAARGAVLVARGEVAPLNPTEGQDAQIFVYNNVFFSFGADGVGTFTSEGGDEAARVATGKDVMGVRLVNQLDIDGLFTPATIVVDYLGRRIVGQSIVPGIFKQREPGENQIDYGAVDGRDVVAADERFASTFSKLSAALKVKKHAVWDKEGARFDLEASVETKGLLGTDGRKYVLDLYRITPLDIAWLEECGLTENDKESDKEDDETEKEKDTYPHRMTVLRPELVESFGRQKMREYLATEHQKLKVSKPKEIKEDEKEDYSESEEDSDDDSESAIKAKASQLKEKKEKEKKEKEEEDDSESESEEDSEDDSESESESEGKDKNKDEGKGVGEGEEKAEDATPKVDFSNFKYALNPDVFSSQVPQTDAEKEEMASDEKDVRDACTFLREVVIPGLINDVKVNETSFPMDGRSLSRTLHKRGINIRYVGQVASKCDVPLLQPFLDICIQEMVARAFKHTVSKYLKYLPLSLSSSCLSHLLNCLIGFKLNPNPVAEMDASVKALYPTTETAFTMVTPQSLRQEITEEVQKRYRYTLASGWEDKVRPLQLLREVSLKLGLQLQSKTFLFEPSTNPSSAAPTTNGVHATANGNGNVEPKKKKKKGRVDSLVASGTPPSQVVTFFPDDIVNIVPVIKDSSPRSTLAEEALEAGRISFAQNQKKLGHDLLLESLSLHEQIYGFLHPEVARVYHQLSVMYYQLEDKDMALELARKAVVVAERTIGVDSDDTLLNYLNLSLFLHQSGNSRSGLVYAQHALDLWKIIYGADHPDSITTMNNAAVMLQHLKEYHESRRWFEESLRVCEKVFGKQSINTGTLLFQLSQALALDGEAKAAVNRMRESYNVFLAELGPDDKNTKEAESWLEQLTQSAVNIAKQAVQAKEVHARRLRAGLRFNPRAMGGSTTARVGGTASGTGLLGKPPSVDSRNIDDLIKFIEGTDQQAKNGAKKRPAGRGNPKRRGGAAA